jgi:hypothetical protein
VSFRPKLNPATPHQNIKDNRIIAIAMQPANPAISEPRLGAIETSKDQFSSSFCFFDEQKQNDNIYLYL